MSTTATTTESTTRPTAFQVLNAARNAAEVRQAKRDARTPQEQIAALDDRLGAGVGAMRERKALAKLAKKK
jgi:hypothetical protein